ncbi:MAG: putative ABC transporter permease [Bacilli bacterium]|nr:putative ABC transporter permease [Bacilli bacterium]
MNIFCNYILYFIIYSIIGWLIEVMSFLVQDKKFVNRGFLIGPICPIYGYGVILIILIIGTDKTDLLSMFLKSIFICSILEYSTSFIMEKLFKARWWDYSQRRFNINGRICLETMLPFGIGATIVLYFIHPLVIKLVDMLSYNPKLIIAMVLLVIYLVDNFISMAVMNKIKKQIKKQKADNTTEIRKKVSTWMNENSYWYRHIKSAFPRFKIIDRVKRIKDVIIPTKKM